MTQAILSQLIVAGAAIGASVAGYLLAGLNEGRRDRRAVERDRVNREADRAAAREDKADDFQLDNLLALQDAVQLMARVRGQAMHFDHMQARKGKYTNLPVALSDEMHANGVKVLLLSSRVLDDNIRTKVADFRAHVSSLVLLPKQYEGLKDERLEAAANRVELEFAAAYERVMDPMGVAVRAALSRMSSRSKQRSAD